MAPYLPGEIVTRIIQASVEPYDLKIRTIGAAFNYPLDEQNVETILDGIPPIRELQSLRLVSKTFRGEVWVVIKSRFTGTLDIHFGYNAFIVSHEKFFMQQQRLLDDRFKWAILSVRTLQFTKWDFMDWTSYLRLFSVKHTPRLRGVTIVPFASQLDPLRWEKVSVSDAEANELAVDVLKRNLNHGLDVEVLEQRGIAVRFEIHGWADASERRHLIAILGREPGTSKPRMIIENQWKFVMRAVADSGEA